MKFRTLLLALSIAVSLSATAEAMARTTLEFRLVVDCKLGDKPMLQPSGGPLCLSSDVIANESDVVSTSSGADPHNSDIGFVRINLNSSGAEKMHTATAAHVQGQMGVVLNGKLISAPMIFEPLSNTIEISFPVSQTSVEMIAAFKSLAVLKP